MPKPGCLVDLSLMEVIVNRRYGKHLRVGHDPMSFGREIAKGFKLLPAGPGKSRLFERNPEDFTRKREAKR